MQIANALKPQDPENEYEMDIFIDLVSIYSAIDSAIGMVEDGAGRWCGRLKQRTLT